MFIFFFKQMIVPVVGSGLPLWARFPIPVQLSETLSYHLDLAHVCAIHCPGWDVGSDLFRGANLQATSMPFRIRSTMTSSEVSLNVNRPL